MANVPIKKKREVNVSPFIHLLTGKPCLLGRTRARRNGRGRLKSVKLLNFLYTIPTPPSSVDNSFGIFNWGELLNDRLGDCTIAGPGHLIQAWTASAGSEQT